MQVKPTGLTQLPCATLAGDILEQLAPMQELPGRKRKGAGLSNHKATAFITFVRALRDNMTGKAKHLPSLRQMLALADAPPQAEEVCTTVNVVQLATPIEWLERPSIPAGNAALRRG